MQSVIATSRGAELSKIFVKGRGARALFEGGGGRENRRTVVMRASHVVKRSSKRRALVPNHIQIFNINQFLGVFLELKLTHWLLK